MTKPDVKITTLGAAFLMAATPLSSAQDTPESDTSAILILDASGSMWGKIGEGEAAQTKIEIARDVVDDMLGTWDADTPLGLMAYGHRKKGDCGDIELLIPPGPLKPEAYSKQVRALNPTGKTPMVKSVVEAAEALSYADQKSTVILVSDGEETCGMDACAMGAALEAKGIDFTAHVIGFDVSLSESAGMRCLADETGGLYLDAENAEELSGAIKVVTEDTTAPIQEDVTGPATVDVAQDSIVGGTRFDVTWTGPENPRDQLVITSPDGETSFHRLSVSLAKDTDRPRLRAPETPGLYRVHYMDRNKTSLAYDEFTVTAATAFIKAPDEGVTGGSRFKVEVSEPNAVHDRIKIYDASGEEVYVRTVSIVRKKDGMATLRAPEEVGEYTVKYVTPNKNVLAEDSFTVIAAKAALEAPDEPVIGGSSFKVKVSEPNALNDRIRIFDASGEEVYVRTVSLVRKKDGMATLRAPEDAGEYTVKFVTQDKNVLAEDSFTVIAATAALEAPDEPVIGGASFKVKVSEPNARNDRIRVFDPTGKEVYARTVTLVRKEDGMATLRAPEDAGEYRVKYMTQDKNVLAEDTLTVIAATAEIDAPDTPITVETRFNVQVSEPIGRQDRLAIFDAAGKQVTARTITLVRKKDGFASLKAPELPGQYTVKYVTPKKNILAEDTITVVAGE